MNKVMSMNKEDVLKLEKELSFNHFDAEDAYCIGNEIAIKQVNQYVLESY